MSKSATPAALGYRWPAEWEPHAATWCSWPRNRNTWPGKFEPVPAQFAKLVQTLARYECVHVLAGGAEVLAEARAHVGKCSGVVLHEIPTNDAWCRDHGPIFLTASENLPPALVDWEYNAWGGKYPPFDLDNAVPARIAELTGRLRFSPGIVMEGGAIEGNGRGTLLTTERCLLNANRNPQLSRQQLESYLSEHLKVRHFLWLREGDLAGDDTDGHIDQLARFVDDRTVVAAVERDENDVNFHPLQANFAQLETMVDQDGKLLRIVPLYLPAAKWHAGQRLPASYLNFYVANGVVVVPQFDDPADRDAVDTLARFFPGRDVIGLPALDLVWGLGAFHCLTQQEPLPHLPLEKSSGP